MKIKYVFILFLFSFIGLYTSYSQEEKFKEIIIDKYVNELKLDDKAQLEFSKVLLKYKPLFEKQQSDNREYNALLKREVLEIYEILNRDQFSEYKKIRKIIEPNKTYRTKG